MLRRLIPAVAAAALVLAMVPTVDAATTWTARFSGRGSATLRVGAPTKLVLGLTGFKAGSSWTVALRKGSCTSVGTLILSTKVTATSAGRLSKTITLTAAQTKAAAKLPLALRVGSLCARFTAPVPVTGVFGDGTWRVGPSPVVPGTYRTVTPPGAFCYWARLSGFGGSDIIENGVGKGPVVVTIDPGDVGFKSSNCGTWRLNAPAAPTAAPGEGIWRVGLDISAGTYQTSVPAGDFCYWARLSGFGGSDIIDNGVASSGPVIVTIDPTDAGFKSSGCGTWVPAS